MAEPKIMATMPYDMTVGTLEISGNGGGAASGYTSIYKAIPTLTNNVFVTDLTADVMLSYLHTPLRMDVIGETYTLTPDDEGMWVGEIDGTPAFALVYQNSMYFFAGLDTDKYAGKTFELSIADVGGIIPYGNMDITYNTELVNVYELGTISVNVPGIVPAGTKYITANGDGIDVSEYQYANVNVASSISSRNVTVQNNCAAAKTVMMCEEGVWVSKTIEAGASDTFKCPAVDGTYGKKRIRFFAMTNNQKVIASYSSSSYPAYYGYDTVFPNQTYIYWTGEVTGSVTPTITLTDAT